MAWLDKMHHPETYLKLFVKWLLLGLLMGAIGGLLGAGFHHALHFVTHVRSRSVCADTKQQRKCQTQE